MVKGRQSVADGRTVQCRACERALPSASGARVSARFRQPAARVRREPLARARLCRRGARGHGTEHRPTRMACLRRVGSKHAAARHERAGWMDGAAHTPVTFAATVSHSSVVRARTPSCPRQHRHTHTHTPASARQYACAPTPKSRKLKGRLGVGFALSFGYPPRAHVLPAKTTGVPAVPS
jgi:hypothetical protein